MLFAGCSVIILLCDAGVAYTSECFLCRPGTFSKTPGSSFCDLCPRNTYSSKGASSCTSCPETQYSGIHSDSALTHCVWVIPDLFICSYWLCDSFSLSFTPEEGWAECKEKPPCSEKDYFQIHTACDANGKVGHPGQHLKKLQNYFIRKMISVLVIFVDTGAVSMGGAQGVCRGCSSSGHSAPFRRERELSTMQSWLLYT